MSDQKRKDGRIHQHRAGATLEGPMAQAFQAARVSRRGKSSPGSAEPTPPRVPVPVTVRKKTAVVSDTALFQKACEGVEPLKKERHSDRVGGREAHQTKKNHHAQRSSGSGTRRKSGRSHTKPQTVTRGDDVPEVITEIQSDGSVKVLIPGTFLELGQPKTQKRRSEVAATTALIVRDTVAIHHSVLISTEAHVISDTLTATYANAVAASGEDEIELFIGFDFGTSFSKVVVREAGSGRAWAIPFSNDRVNPYLICTNVWRSGNAFTLSPGTGYLGNLKMALFEKTASLTDEINAAAFIGLVLRHVKAWFWKQKSVEFPDTSPLWYAHIGLPASDLQENRLVEKFKRVLWAGMLLAEQKGDKVDEAGARLCLSAAGEALSHQRDSIAAQGFGLVHRDQVSIFPEIAAQIYGYLKSDRRDPTQEMFMLVDVGGGTVDAALFRVVESRQGDTQFVFLGTAVEPHGVYLLHRARIAWHIQQMKGTGQHPRIVRQLQDLLDSKVVPKAVPGAIQDYLNGADYPERTCDALFFNAFGKMLWNNVVMAAHTRVGRPVAPGERLEFLLCGGGRSIALYNKFIQRINAPNSSTQLRLRPIEIGRPTHLEPRNIGTMEYHRLSVAYGLSFDDIGEVITPDQLRPVPTPTPAPDITERYTSKEDT